MKCNPQRTLDYQYLEKKRKEEQDKEAYINSLTEEQRIEYLQKQEEKRKKSMEMISQMSGIIAALGIKEIY